MYAVRLKVESKEMGKRKVRNYSAIQTWLMPFLLIFQFSMVLDAERIYNRPLNIEFLMHASTLSLKFKVLTYSGVVG